jgi:ribulose 1,5-bisphosphate synthetase/thiazole synthase
MPQSQREIPVIASVDVVIAGGTVAAVAAAESAASKGAKVFLAAPRPYLGDDLCATLRLEPNADRPLASTLEKKLFDKGRPARPAHVKATLAETLLKAGVEFTFGSYVTDVLRDDEGRPCGVVIANRGGRQAVVAKITIDATSYAWVCRTAGCTSAPWPGGEVRFHRMVLQAGGKAGRGRRKKFETQAHTLDIEMPDLSFASLAEAEQVARDRTYTGDLLRGAESLFCVPPNPIPCRKSQKDFATGASLDLGHFRPREQERLWVLSGCADIPRAEAAKLLRPAAMTAIADEIGRAAPAEARGLSQPDDVHVSRTRAATGPSGDIREDLSGARPIDLKLPVVRSAAAGVPVLAEVDVVVVGGGTAGAPAAIAAARRGARTLVVEYQEGLGGVGTLGMIGHPYHGRKAGFAKEVPFPNSAAKMEWYRAEIRKAGGSIWFGALGCGALVDGNTVKGAVVCTPEGRGVVLAKVVIDATGSADVAISAGADYMYGALKRDDLALQGTGFCARAPGVFNANSDRLLVDESDMVDVRRALISMQLRMRSRYDVGTLIQTRERRRVVGDFVMRYVDQIAERQYRDAVVLSESDYDLHSYPISSFFALLPHDERSRRQNHPAPGGSCFTPYRCLLPRGLEGILVVGLGISVHRDALAMVRMQLDVANQGYAAGVAAAMAARAGTGPRRIDVRDLQRHLVQVGNLPKSVLTHEDSFPLPAAEVRQAVLDYGKATNPKSAGKPLAVILTHRQAALPLLRRAYERAEGQAKRLYAQVLATFGDQDVVPTLLSALNDVDQWDAKIFQGHMSDHAYLPTPVDAVILALGRATDRSATPAILRMLDRLDAGIALSHHRAVALALERLQDPSAAKPLADLLRKPGMQGHALTSVPAKGRPEKRTESLREISVARALYRCGDHQGLGRKILAQYTRDLRGLFARHAWAVLNEQ